MNSCKNASLYNIQIKFTKTIVYNMQNPSIISAIEFKHILYLKIGTETMT